MNTYHYTYLITNLSPITSEKYYIGVRTSLDVEPTNDRDYMGSSEYIATDIKEFGKGNFEKIIVAEWPTRELASAHEIWLHGWYNVRDNELFYNRTNARSTGFCGGSAKSNAKQSETKLSANWKETTGKHAIARRNKTIADPQWRATIGEEMSKKISKTMSDIKWKETVGYATVNARKETINSASWKNTVGPQAVRKQKETRANVSWRATIGVQAIQKHKDTIRDQAWINTVGKIQAKKISETKSSPLWIDANTFICPHCDRSIKGKSNFNRWHGDNCKVLHNA